MLSDCILLLNMVVMLTESKDFSEGMCADEQCLHFLVDVEDVKIILTLRLRFSHRPIFRISSSRFCSVRSCGWESSRSLRGCRKNTDHSGFCGY